MASMTRRAKAIVEARTPKSVPLRSTRAKKRVAYAEDSDSALSSSDDKPLIHQARRLPKRKIKSLKLQHVALPPERATSRTVPWHALPYQVWLQIFLYDCERPDARDKSRTRASWLLGCARVCRSCTEPALSALYNTVSLTPAWRAHAFLKRLRDDQRTSVRNKVHYLVIEDPLVFGRKYNKHDPIEVVDFITECPQLRGLLVSRFASAPLWHPFRTPRHRPPDAHERSRHNDLLETSISIALQSNDIRLREWHWAGYNYDEVHETNFQVAHEIPSFQSIQHLTLTSIKPAIDESLLSSRAAKTHEINAAKTAVALALLPALKSLRFSKSMIFLTHVLPSIPATVRLLEITDCSLTSEALSSFLADHGYELRSLILDHNDTLNLGFLGTLAISCPNLEKLHMDLRYFPQHLAFNDSEPKFDELLPPGITPMWPVTLQSVELFHLRKWNTDAAGRFFSSLVSSSSDLPMLRTLRIKASIEESAWRTRITFRNNWIKRLNHIFKRPFFTPKGYEKNHAPFPEVIVPLKRGKKPSEPRSDSESTAAPVRRSVRLKTSPPIPTEDESLIEDSKSERYTSSKDGFAEDFIQGMCNVVDIAIDTLRPVAEQLNEADFLDEEASGDSDWSESKENRRLMAEERNAW